MFRTTALVFASSAAAIALTGVLAIGLHAGTAQHSADGTGDPGTTQTDPGQTDPATPPTTTGSSDPDSGGHGWIG